VVIFTLVTFGCFLIRKPNKKIMNCTNDYGFPFCIVKPLMETCVLLIMEKKEFGHTSLAIRGIPSCLSWWCPTSKLERDILFLKLYSIDNCFVAEVWWTLLGSWKKKKIDVKKKFAYLLFTKCCSLLTQIA
jgi:hypothetical protein